MRELPEIHIRPSVQGDAGYVAYMHGRLYKELYNLGGTAEYYFMLTLTEFVQNPEGGCLWIAEADGEIVGSVGIVKRGEDTAQLRWFLVDNKQQGRGIGEMLMQTALTFCREHGYKNVFLWTYKGLDAARHLYEKHGFTLTEEKPNFEWKDEMVLEQRMDLRL